MDGRDRVEVTCLLVGILFLNETLTLQQITGMLIITAGLVSIDGRVARLFKK